MPLVKEHIERSKKRTRKTYQELHEWMDTWESDRANAKAMHDILNIPANFIYAKKKWGDEGASEFLHHLKDDAENYKRGFLYKVHKILWSVKKRLN